MICPKCRGKKTIIDIAVGLGNQHLEPCYAEKVCPECHGSGHVHVHHHVKDEHAHRNLIYGTPNSFFFFKH